MSKANTSQSSDFLLTNDAARRLNVSPQTIRVWERAGRLPAVKTERGTRLFDRRDVEQLAREREERPAAGDRCGTGGLR